MSFVETVKEIVSSSGPITPQEIREVIKKDHREFYGTPAHVENVKRGHYKDVDHAVLAQIYNIAGTNRCFNCDKSSKPMKVSLATEAASPVLRSMKPNRSQANVSWPGRAIGYDGKIRDILENADTYHRAYYKANTFRGPSLYFHHRALETRQEPSSLAHLEYIYATLSAWGMHRMGRKGSKMQSFDVFRQSIELVKDRIAEAQRFDLREMNEHGWDCLEEIFRGVKVMASGTTLVGNSKVMHHMLPNIIPPIDREYTLWFTRGNTNLKNDLDYEWQVMKDIISKVFIPVACDGGFRAMADRWMARKQEYPWDTSYLKIVDNLIIGLKNRENAGRN